MDLYQTRVLSRSSARRCLTGIMLAGLVMGAAGCRHIGKRAAAPTPVPDAANWSESGPALTPAPSLDSLPTTVPPMPASDDPALPPLPGVGDVTPASNPRLGGFTPPRTLPDEPHLMLPPPLPIGDEDESAANSTPEISFNDIQPTASEEESLSLNDDIPADLDEIDMAPLMSDEQESASGESNLISAPVELDETQFRLDLAESSLEDEDVPSDLELPPLPQDFTEGSTSFPPATTASVTPPVPSVADTSLNEAPKADAIKSFNDMPSARPVVKVTRLPAGAPGSSVPDWSNASSVHEIVINPGPTVPKWSPEPRPWNPPVLATPDPWPYSRDGSVLR